MSAQRSDGAAHGGPAISGRERLVTLLGSRKQYVVGLALSSVVAAFAEAALLITLAQIAAKVVAGHHHATTQTAHLYGLEIHGSLTTLFVIATALAIVRLIMQFPLSYLPARISADVQAQLRKDVAESFAATSWAEQSSDREGHLQETMTTQVLQATQGAIQTTTLISAGITLVILMFSAFTENARAAAVIFVISLVLLLLLRPLNRLGKRRARELSRSQLDYAGALSEMQRVSAEARVFGVAQAQRERLEEYVGKARDLFFRTQVVVRLTPNLYQSLIYLLLILGLFALYEISHSSLASLGAVILLMWRVGAVGQQLQGAQQGLRQSLPFIERVQDAARRYAAAVPVTGDAPLAKVEQIEFNAVSFGYREGQIVLDDISCEVASGEAVGVIGPSGAGKSTFVQLLLELREPTSGAYRVNGVDAASYSREDWHRAFSYVPQEPKLLHATVAENIRFRRTGISDAAVERAARLANIDEVIRGWPKGYETVVGPRADAISGGQQQRICLARALAAEPSVLVLDEPTSALDPQSEAAIQATLTELKGELMIFIVAHRMSTLEVCDRVMVILDGRLVAFEPVAVLERESAYYRRATALAAGGALP